MKTYFNFQHDYYKLDNNTFTTIRGKTAAKQYKLFQEVTINLKRKLFCKAIITNIMIAPISDFSLKALKEDGEYPGLEITSKKQFVDLINSFLPSFYCQATLNSEKTLFTLRKLFCKQTI